MTRIPQLTEDIIRRFVGQKNFSKGLQAINNGALVDPVQQGMTLKAYCYGSLPEPYRVQVSCDDTGITTAFCSCSVDTVIKGKQACEHVATLLLCWYKQPETFTPMDDLETILERQSKAQLLTLIKQLLQQQPEVEWALTMPPLSGYKSVPIDPDEYRHQVDAAFQQAGREWDAVYGIASDLYQITATASHFAQKRDYANVATLYEVVAMTTLSHYLSYHDEDSALGRVVQDCVENLGTCLEHVQSDIMLRQQILAAIFSVHRFDVDHGGFGLTKDIPPQLLQTTTGEEKSLIAQWVRTALVELQHNSQESVWRRQRYGGLLLALEADSLSDEAFLRIGRETKNTQAVVTRLLQRGRVDEAVQDASQTDGWQAVKLADLFVQYGQDRAVEALMDEKARQERHTQAAQWLQNHYLARGYSAAALEMAELIFRRRPWMPEYQQMRELSLPLGTWKEVRQAACKFLEVTRNSSLLVAIALDEGDEERALQLLEAATPHGPDGLQWKYDYARTPEGALQTAERAEEHSPRAAIDLYQQHVEHLIAGRGRGNYQAACHYLKKIQALYEKLQETEQWMTYLTGVRKRHSRLATLKEELKAVGLL